MTLDLPDIERLRAQDHAAFETLAERHYVPIRRYLTRLVANAEIAAELTQDTFLRAYQALPRLADDSDVPAWLYRIATNLARQHYRHGRLIHWRAIEPHHLASPSLEDGFAQQDLVRRAIEGLSLDQRACLLLYSWTGYTCAEIGQITDRSAEAVRMLLVRARRRFRELYDGLERGEDLPPHVTSAGGTPPNGRQTPGAIAGATTIAADAELSPCDTAAETLPLYARGDLPLDAFRHLTEHLATCAHCRDTLHSEQSLNRIVQRSLVLAFASLPAAWHASSVASTQRPRPLKGELDGSTQVVGIVQVHKVRQQVERQVSQDGDEVGRQVSQGSWQVGEVGRQGRQPRYR